MDSPMIEPKLWTSDMIDRWLATVDKHVQRVQRPGVGKSWMRFIDANKVSLFPVEHPDNCVYVGGYVILVTADVPWYSRERFLQELLVTRIDEGPGDYNVVLRSLEALAHRAKASAIVVGDAFTLDDRLQRVYEHDGYRREATSLIKEI